YTIIVQHQRVQRIGESAGLLLADAGHLASTAGETASHIRRDADLAEMHKHSQLLLQDAATVPLLNDQARTVAQLAAEMAQLATENKDARANQLATSGSGKRTSLHSELTQELRLLVLAQQDLSHQYSRSLEQQNSLLAILFLAGTATCISGLV